MRKKSNTQNVRYKFFKLYLEDIYEISEIMSKCSVDNKLGISANEYILESIEEIENPIFNKIKSLEIKSSSFVWLFYYKLLLWNL